MSPVSGEVLWGGEGVRPGPLTVNIRDFADLTSPPRRVSVNSPVSQRLLVSWRITPPALCLTFESFRSGPLSWKPQASPTARETVLRSIVWLDRTTKCPGKLVCQARQAKKELSRFKPWTRLQRRSAMISLSLPVRRSCLGATRYTSRHARN